MKALSSSTDSSSRTCTQTIPPRSSYTQSVPYTGIGISQRNRPTWNTVDPTRTTHDSRSTIHPRRRTTFREESLEAPLYGESGSNAYSTRTAVPKTASYTLNDSYPLTNDQYNSTPNSRFSSKADNDANPPPYSATYRTSRTSKIRSAIDSVYPYYQTLAQAVGTVLSILHQHARSLWSQGRIVFATAGTKAFSAYSRWADGTASMGRQSRTTRSTMPSPSYYSKEYLTSRVQALADARARRKGRSERATGMTALF